MADTRCQSSGTALLASMCVGLRCSHGPADGRRLRIALAICLATGALELFGGLITGSLALLADAGHVLVDSAPPP